MKKSKELTDQELQIVEPKPTTEMLEIAKNSGLLITEAQSIAIKFAPYMATVNEYGQLIANLEKENPTESDAKLAREYRLKLVANRGKNGMDVIHTELKAGIVIKGKLIDNLYNTVENTSKLSEIEAESIEKHQERLAAKKQDELAESRINLLAEFGTDTSYLPLKIMTDEQFDRLFENEKLAFNARKEAAEKAELARIEAERLAEEQRKEAERLQAERIESDRLEAIRVKAELAEKEAELQKEREESAERERVRVETELKAKEQRELLNRRFEQMILKEISGIGFEKVDDGIQNSELGWFIGKRHFDHFDTELEAIEWFKETKERVRIMTEQAKKEADNKKAMIESEAKLAEQQRLAKIESDKQSAELAKQKQAANKLAAELQAKKDAEAKAESDRLLAEKQALAAPDKEKVRALHTTLKAIVIPEFTTAEGKEIGNTMREALDILIKGLVQDSKKLL